MLAQSLPIEPLPIKQSPQPWFVFICVCIKENLQEERKYFSAFPTNRNAGSEGVLSFYLLVQDYTGTGQ